MLRKELVQLEYTDQAQAILPIKREEFYPTFHILAPEDELGKELTNCIMDQLEKSKPSARGSRPKRATQPRRPNTSSSSQEQTENTEKVAQEQPEKKLKYRPLRKRIRIEQIADQEHLKIGPRLKLKYANQVISHDGENVKIKLPSPKEMLQGKSWRADPVPIEKAKISKNSFIFARSQIHPLLSVFTLNEVSRILSALWNDRQHSSACDYYTMLASSTLICYPITELTPSHLRVREDAGRIDGDKPFYSVIDEAVDDHETAENPSTLTAMGSETESSRETTPSATFSSPQR